MMRLQIPTFPDRPLRLLCLGAHPDDIEIGAGGFVRRLIREHGPVEVTWVVFSGTPQRRREAEASAKAWVTGARSSEIIVLDHQDGFFPAAWAEIKRAVEALKRVDPDIVLTHARDDRHQDHRTLSDLAWNTFRDHLVLEYEIPKFDGDLGQPNIFVGLSPEDAKAKCRHIYDHFESQRDKHWFAEETLMGLMRIRGMETGRTAPYAEGFHVRKAALSFGKEPSAV